MNRNTPISLSKAKNGLKSDPFRQLERNGHLNAEFFLA